MKKFLKRILIYCAVGTIITVVALVFVENYIYKLNNSGENVVSSSTSDNNKNSETYTKISIPNDANSVQYSYDNKYYTYLKDNEIYINNIDDGKNVTKISDKNNICYYNLLYDKNLIVYFTKVTTNNLTKITLKTYDIASKNTRDDSNTISIYNFSKIKNMDFSPVINIIYLNVETIASSKESDVIYRIDLFQSISKYTSGIISENMVMLKNKDVLYYENSVGNIYYKKLKSSLFNEKVNLIGTDSDDNVYLINTRKTIIYKLANNKIVSKINITDSNVISTYSNNTDVYLIYDTYVLNVSSDDNTKKLGIITENQNFDAIKESTMYLRTSDNKVIKQKLK